MYCLPKSTSCFQVALKRIYRNSSYVYLFWSSSCHIETQQTDQKAIQVKTREDYVSSKFLYKEHTLKLLRSYCSKALLL